MVLSCFFNDTATTEIYTDLHTLSLHDALPISAKALPVQAGHARDTASCNIAQAKTGFRATGRSLVEGRSRHAGTSAHGSRSEEHTSELQSLMRISYAVFCLKKTKTTNHK